MKERSSTLHINKTFFTSLVVFAILIILTQYLAFQRYLIDKDNQKTKVLQELNSVKDRIKTNLANGLSATKTLAFIVENYGVPADFEKLGQQILESNKNIDALQLTRRGIITHVYPMAGNTSVIGYDILSDSARNREAHKAIEKRALYFAGPFELRQGGIAFVGRLPIFIDDKFWGFSAVLIKLSTFLREAGIDRFQNKEFIYQLSKYNTNTHREEFFLPDTAIPYRNMSASIYLKDGELKLTVSPKSGPYLINAIALSVFGIILATICGLFTRSALKRPELLKELVRKKTKQLAASETYFRSLLEKSADAIVLLDESGITLYQTPSTEKIIGYTLNEMQSLKGLNLIHPDDREGDSFIFNYLVNNPGISLRRNHRVKHKDGHYIWIEGTYTSLLHDETIQAIIYNYHDVSLRIASEEKAVLANRLYEVTSRINRMMINVSNENSLFSEVCQIAVNFGKFRMAWIGVVDQKEQQIVPVTFAGEEKDYLSKIKSITLDDSEAGIGPTGNAMKTGNYVFCNDIENDPKMRPWAKEALARGYKSSIALPIIKFGKVIGTFSLYAGITDYFNPNEISLLEEMTADISYTLENLENEKLRREAENEVLKVYKDKETTLNRIDDGVVAVDNKWTYTFLNEAALKEHPSGKQSTLGRGIWDVHPEMINTIFWDKYHEAMEQKKVVAFESFYPPMGLWFFVKVYPSDDGLTIFYNNISERKKAEEQISAEKNLSESIINSLPGIFYFYDKAGKFLRWNKNFENISGYSADEILKLNPLDFYDDDEKELMKNKIDSVFEHGMDDIEAHFFTKNRQKIPYYFNGYQVNFSGKDYLIGMGIDITERKKIENELKENEAKYRLLFNKSPIATWMISIPSYDIIDVNDVAINHYGYSREEFIGMNSLALRPKEDLEKFEKEIIPSQWTKNALAGKWRHKKKSGEIIIVEVITHEFSYGKERVRLVLANDVTDRERAEKKLRESEARLTDAQSVAKVGNWETDLKTKKVIWSEEIYRIFEIEPIDLEITYHSFLDFVHPEDRERVRDAYVTSYNSVSINSIEHRIITAKGKNKIVEQRWRTYCDDTGYAFKAMGTCQDITDRKKTEGLILQSQVELRKLYTYLQTVREEERTGIAREIHDELGQQLTALKMDSFWIQKKLDAEDLPLKERLSGMISLIDETIKTVRRIASELRPGILDDLGLLAAIEWQGQEFEKRTGIKCVFKSTLTHFNPGKDLSTHVFRVYQESLTNTLRHAHASLIETTMDEKDGYLRMEISDNGIGFNLDEAKNKNSLGLMGMKERALLFNGELLVESRPLRGTRITLKIPILNLKKEI